MEQRNPEELLLPFDGPNPSRRSFLHLAGFGIASTALAGCSRGPVQHAIAALDASREFVPGRAYWIASTCGGCEAGCGVLAKCRDGRPIKLEGVPGHPISGGGLCPSGQGSILSLYDSQRFDGPRHQGQPATWEQSDREIRSVLDSVRSSAGRIRLLTGTINGPSTRAAIRRFLSGFPDARHVVYDGLSASAVVDAHGRTHGRRILPRYRFERARTIVSFDADFLSTWISPVEFTHGYTLGRSLEENPARMSKHFQLEARTSLTGCRADERVRVAPWETGAMLGGLCDLLERRSGGPQRFAGSADDAPGRELLERMADELWSSREEGLVVAGSNEVEIQLLVNYANHLLGSYGSTLDVAHPSLQRLGDDRALESLAAELEEGSVDVLIVQGVNPAYDLAGRLPIGRAKLLVSCAGSPDETSAEASWVCPEAHFLEAWNDAEPYEGTFVLSQPTVPVLRSGRTLRELLARWAGDERSDRELFREPWRTELFQRQSSVSDFDTFFDQALHEGFVVLEGAREPAPPFQDNVRPSAQSSAPPAGMLGLVLYPKAGMLDGRNGHNPWLHELPDPVSKITWDNYACLSPATAERLGIGEGDVLRVSPDDGDAANTIELPAHIQAGQHDGVLAVALGYGRAGTDRFTDVGPEWVQGKKTVEPGGVVGVSAAALVTHAEGTRRFADRSVAVAATGKSVRLASTQDYHSLSLPEHLAVEGHEVREMVFSTTFDEWRKDPGAGIHHHPVPRGELWPQDHGGDTTWGMSIDLARCTGCSACVIGCQSENNVPVVGRDEVARHREMSWLRIDRYYQGEGDDLRTLHQPMLCQHCDHAPCESVCPVLATVHSEEGLNQQVYNRCVGTRYCANTCPYKVRRFNWFDYAHDDAMENHSLNPDVTIRSRGVMEKCSFCVQRIQEARSEAHREGRECEGRRHHSRVPAVLSCPSDRLRRPAGSGEPSRAAGGDRARVQRAGGAERAPLDSLPESRTQRSSGPPRSRRESGGKQWPLRCPLLPRSPSSAETRPAPRSRGMSATPWREGPPGSGGAHSLRRSPCWCSVSGPSGTRSPRASAPGGSTALSAGASTSPTSCSGSVSATPGP